MDAWLTIAGRPGDLPGRGWREEGSRGLHYAGPARLRRPPQGSPLRAALDASGAERVRLAPGPGLVALLSRRDVRTLLADPPAGVAVLAVGADAFDCRARLDRTLLRLVAAASAPPGAGAVSSVARTTTKRPRTRPVRQARRSAPAADIVPASRTTSRARGGATAGIGTGLVTAIAPQTELEAQRPGRRAPGVPRARRGR